MDRPQDPGRDARGNALEDIMAYAIAESIDHAKFKQMLDAREDAGERRRHRLLPQQQVMYDIMETHFTQREALAGSTPAPSPPPISPISPDRPGNGNGAAGAAGAATRAPAPAGGRRPRELRPPGSNAAAASAPAKTKTKVLEAEFEEIFSISKLGDPTYARRMKTFYEENGIFCIDLEDKIDKRKAMREFVTSLFGQMPYRDEFLLNFRLDNGKEVHLNTDGDIDDIVDVLLQKRISTENLNRLKKCLPPHATFGAPCTPPSFHLHVENEIRQDQELYRAIAGVLDNERINCDFNRAIFRVPTVTEGEEFLHFDLDPRAIRPGVDSELQGKVCITECRFICVPGSNTADFLEKFKEAYDPLYPGRKLGQAKYSLDPDRDPWKLFEQQRAFIVPAGHAVFWSPKILHGHPSFGRETPISIGFYLGFHPEVSAAEREIRTELFRTGGIPKAWPSGDPVCFFPRKFQNFPKVLKSTVIDKLTPRAYQALVTTRVTKLGKEVPDMKPWGWDPVFKPFPFTDHGKRITGQRKWGDETKSQAEQRRAAGDESVVEIGQAPGASQNHPPKRHRPIVPTEPPASSDFASSDFANAVALKLRVLFSERLVSVLTTRRTSPQTLIAVFDELNAMPHVAIKAPSTLGEGQIRDMIMMDKLLEATTQARAKAKAAFERTPWALRNGENSALIDGIDEPDGSAIQDGCAICGAPRPECINPAHFGARGESPPDSICQLCKMNFHNRYDSEHALQLHVAAVHAATHQSLKRSRYMVLPEPPASASAPASSDFASSDFANAVAPELRVFFSDFANVVAPELRVLFSERLVQVLTTRRTSPLALLAVFDELNAMPHVAIKAPSTLGEGQIRDMILMDKLFEATTQARAKAKAAFERTPWARQHANNCGVLSDAATIFKCGDEDDDIAPDGCAICGVVKTECMNTDEHFGKRGESPPDAKCPWCTRNFWNKYDSQYDMQRHVDEKHIANHT
jgi:hypothetical protein